MKRPFSKSQPSRQVARRSRSYDDSLSTRPSNNAAFRRNQTITGSRSSHVSSTAEMNGTVLSPRAQSHHLYHQRRKIVRRLVAVVGVLILIYIAVGQLISETRVTLAKGSLSTSQMTLYQSTIDKYLNHQPSQRFYPVLDQSSLLRALQDQHPEISNVSMRLSGEIGVSEARIILRQPVARWSLNGREEFVDNYGYVFLINGFDTPTVQIVDESGLDPSGGVVTSNRFLGFVGKVVGQMSSNGYTVEKASIPLLTTRQIAITVSGINYPIKMIIDRSAGEQVEDATRVIKYLANKGTHVEYIDVRVKGKAFYR